MANDLAVINGGTVQQIDAAAELQSRFLPVMSITTAVQRFKAIEQAVQHLMVENEDFGKVPGSKKPSLWKPGAEKLSNLFGLVPKYEELKVTEDWTGEQHAGEPFFYYRVKCVLFRGDFIMGEGEGSCNSWESKYRYRNSERECPKCGSTAIIKGKAEYGGGYVCFQKKGGCGAKFAENDPAIGEQRVGKVANPDIFDLVNTVLKMANKRAQIAATLNATGASRFFTQDLEDLPSVDTTWRAGQYMEGQLKSAPSMDTAGIETGNHPIDTQAAADHVAQQKIADMKQKGGNKERFPGQFTTLKVFREIKPKIGSEGYYRILGNAGYEHANEITNLETSRKVYMEMEALRRKQMADAAQQESQPAARVAEAASDDLWAEGRE